MSKTGEQTEPSLEGVIEQLMSGGFFGTNGWRDIDSAGAAMAKNRQDLRNEFTKEHQIIRDTFKTEAGQQCLELFLDQTLRRSAWPAEMNFGMDILTSLGIAREGQNAFVAAIIEAYAAADEDDETKVKSRTET